MRATDMFFYAKHIGGILSKFIQNTRRSMQVFRKREDGSTAIEFSLLCFPFVTLLLGIIEICYVFACATILEGSLTDAARLIRTGQIQDQAVSDPQEMFQNALCDAVPIIVNCDQVQYEVISIDSSTGFAGATALGAQFDGDGQFVPRGFNPGGVSDVVLVRAVYQYPMMTPLISQLMTGDSGSMTMMSTLVFQTEPYEFQEEDFE